MIKVNVDLSLATQTEKEAFLTLPHIAGAIDTLAQLRTNEVCLSLVVDNGQKLVDLVPQYKSRN